MKITGTVRKTVVAANGETAEYCAGFEQQIDDAGALPDAAKLKEYFNELDKALGGCKVHVAMLSDKPAKGKPDAPATAKQLATLDGLMLQKGVTKEAIMGEYEIEDFDKLTVAQCRPIIGDLMGGKVPQKPEMPF